MKTKRLHVEVDGTNIGVRIGNRIRLRRTLLGMSMEKMADQMGLSYQQIQKMEKGANRCSADALYLLSSILGVPVSFFFDDLDTGHSGGGEAQLKRRHLEMCRMFERMPEDVQQRLYSLMKALAPADVPTAVAA